MITEKDVVDILPSECWITHYINYCAKQTTSPLAYHLGVGLSLLASTTPQNYTMRFFGKNAVQHVCDASWTLWRGSKIHSALDGRRDFG